MAQADRVVGAADPAAGAEVLVVGVADRVVGAVDQVEVRAAAT